MALAQMVVKKNNYEKIVCLYDYCFQLLCHFG